MPRPDSGGEASGAQNGISFAAGTRTLHCGRIPPHSGQTLWKRRTAHTPRQKRRPRPCQRWPQVGQLTDAIARTGGVGAGS
jgi:hypothetical protein